MKKMNKLELVEIAFWLLSLVGWIVYLVFGVMLGKGGPFVVTAGYVGAASMVVAAALMVILIITSRKKK